MNNPREAAFLACLSAVSGESFASESIDAWRQKGVFSPRDLRFVEEITYGTLRRRYSLDYLAQKISGKSKKLKLARTERLLLHIGLYQGIFMDRVPWHAIAYEMVRLAKKHCSTFFAAFLNALLRRASQEVVSLPDPVDVESSSIYHSYPVGFVQSLVDAYGFDRTQEILMLGNRAPSLMYRVRGEEPFSMGSGLLVEDVMNDARYYIQNRTPVELLKHLMEGAGTPKKVLDLCAAPGGKLILLLDVYSKAEITANDVSAAKLVRVRENLKKYGYSVNLTESRGEDFIFSDPFGLILIDAPCSNTGVLNKRPEARWRLDVDQLNELHAKQFSIVQHAVQGLSDHGELWYMTCSILPEENEQMVARLCRELSLVVRGEMKLQLPTEEGYDGGFACALRKKG